MQRNPVAFRGRRFQVANRPRRAGDLADKRLHNEFGAPGGIRTPDLQLRRLLLYPAELQARDTSVTQESEFEKAGLRELVFHFGRAAPGFGPAQCRLEGRRHIKPEHQKLLQNLV